MSGLYLATANPQDKHHNTLVLGDIEVVIPLEEDLDGDPNTPDCVRLRNVDGLYESELTVGDAEVEKDGDNPLYYYHFSMVPVGQYCVEVRVGEEWRTILLGLRVSHQGAFVGDVSFEATTDGSKLGTPELDLADDEPVDADSELGCC